jgi:hypothetical protein
LLNNQQTRNETRFHALNHAKGDDLRRWMSISKGLRRLAATAMCKVFKAECEKTLHTDETVAMKSRGNLRVSSTFKINQQPLH